MRQNRLLKTAIVLLFMVANVVVFGQARQDNFRFTSFEIGGNVQNIAINWTVAQEENSNYFIVERSIDGKKFKTIMIVLGPESINNETDKFKSTHKISTKIKSYYRLKHINKAGMITFSPVKTPDFNQ